MQLLTLPKLAARSGWPGVSRPSHGCGGCCPTFASMVGFCCRKPPLKIMSRTTLWPPQVGQLRWGAHPELIRPKSLIPEADQ
jgi:hypothetical protein